MTPLAASVAEGPRLPVFFSILLASAVVAFVTATVRRSNRRKAPFEVPTDSAGRPVAEAWEKPFVVRHRRWQVRAVYLCAILMLLSGAVALLVGLTGSNAGSATTPLLVGLVLFVLAAGFVYLARWTGRFQVTITGRQLMVRLGSGKIREYQANEIGNLRLTPSRYGGMKVCDLAGHRIFEVERLAIGYGQLYDWMLRHRPDLPMPANSVPLERETRI